MTAKSTSDYIYDRFGAVKLELIHSSSVFYEYLTGRPVGFIANNDAVYNYNGVQVGWYEGGILRDVNGAVAGFNDNPTDSPRPFLPFKQYRPYAPYKQYAPHKPYPQYPRFKPFKQYAWSNILPEVLFSPEEWSS